MKYKSLCGLSIIFLIAYFILFMITGNGDTNILIMAIYFSIIAEINKEK